MLTLPNEILVQIVVHTDLSSVASLARTCRVLGNSVAIHWKARCGIYCPSFDLSDLPDVLSKHCADGRSVVYFSSRLRSLCACRFDLVFQAIRRVPLMGGLYVGDYGRLAMRVFPSRDSPSRLAGPHGREIINVVQHGYHVVAMKVTGGEEPQFAVFHTC